MKDISKDYNRYIDTAITVLEELKLEEGTTFFNIKQNRHNRIRITVNDLIKKAYDTANKNKFIEEK